jgi:hypothetical protein
MFEDAQRTLEYQFETGESLDDKAAQVFRFAVLLAGLVLTGASIIVSREAPRDSVPGWVMGALGVGLALLVAAGVLALLAYRATKLRIGLKAESVRNALDDEDLDEETFHREALQAYADGIVDNSQSLNATVTYLNPATWSLLAGVIVLAAGTVGLLLVTGPL